MIGQKKILSKIENVTLSTFPHALMLEGSRGSGRKLLIHNICQKLGFEYIDITNTISKELLDEIYLKTIPMVYVINIDNLTIKQENSILKFVEEPLNTIFIVFVTENKDLVIPTIVNRCQVWTLQTYSKQELETLIINREDIFILDYVDTPGELLAYQRNKDNILQMIAMSDKILDCISRASIPNILTIPDKMCFDKEQNKWDVDHFINILYHTIKRRYMKHPELSYYEAYRITSKLCYALRIPRINKRKLVENYLLDLKYIMRS